MTDFEINRHMYVCVGCVRLWMWGVWVFRLLAQSFVALCQQAISLGL